MAKVYTPAVFELFQDEFMLFLASCISEKNEAQSLCQYIITRVNHQGSWRVSFDRASISISCSCRKFETFGILCSHALKVFDVNDIKVMPDKYIVKRWSREARNGIVHDVRGKKVEGDLKLSSTRRFRQVVTKFVRLAAEVSPSEEYHKIVDDGVNALCKQIRELRLQPRNLRSNNSDNPTVASDDLRQPKVFKQCIGFKRQYKRLKSWPERLSTRKKRAQTKGQSCSQVNQVKELSCHHTDVVPCSTPSAYEAPQKIQDQFSFTAYLMAPLDEIVTPTSDDLSSTPNLHSKN